MTLPLLGITIGDPAGVGPEVVLKALHDGAVHERARVVVLGERRSLEHYRRSLGLEIELRAVASPADARPRRGAIDVLEVSASPATVVPGRVDAECGRVAGEALVAGGRLCAEGRLDGLVTAPVHKAALHAAGYRVEGQTELLGELWGGGRYGMLVVADALRVLLLTRHLPLREALARVTTDGVADHLQLLHDTLLRFGVAKPSMAVAGFNPHAGEGGLFGTEDADILAPAVTAARARGLLAHGPLPADSLFARAARGEFDGVLSLYHDQGLIAAKAVAFERAVTVLAGARFLRVSVIH
ncbi:MAG TPA: 4-hydroxythreonine-4-phosphate dehydrogenase PdxA, partial [Planctomycetota bacterium]|nr:4-hydroxythreonine-4-phosphate dehydrogenase PdxA [Planctomycetota bacterium]